MSTIAGQLGGPGLDGHLPAESRVPSEVDDARAAAAEFADHPDGSDAIEHGGGSVGAAGGARTWDSENAVAPSQTTSAPE